MSKYFKSTVLAVFYCSLNVVRRYITFSLKINCHYPGCIWNNYRYKFVLAGNVLEREKEKRIDVTRAQVLTFKKIHSLSRFRTLSKILCKMCKKHKYQILFSYDVIVLYYWYKNRIYHTLRFSVFPGSPRLYDYTWKWEITEAVRTKRGIHYLPFSQLTRTLNTGIFDSMVNRSLSFIIL